MHPTQPSLQLSLEPPCSSSRGRLPMWALEVAVSHREKVQGCCGWGNMVRWSACHWACGISADGMRPEMPHHSQRLRGSKFQSTGTKHHPSAEPSLDGEPSSAASHPLAQSGLSPALITSPARRGANLTQEKSRVCLRAQPPCPLFPPALPIPLVSAGAGASWPGWAAPTQAILPTVGVTTHGQGAPLNGDSSDRSLGRQQGTAGKTLPSCFFP